MVERIGEGGTPGAIVNMSSVNAVFAIANQVPYSVSKGGINQLTKVMALALAPHGIRVNAIGPGSIMTDMLAGAMDDPEARKRILSRTPLGRIGEPAEIAAIAAFLASDEASYITGQTIYADGGRLPLNYTVPVKGAGPAWTMQIAGSTRVEFRFRPRPWPFAEARRAEIDAHFRAAQAAQPALWNGRVLLPASMPIADRVMTGTYLETDFASFLAWRDWGFPRTGFVRNVFPQAALLAADGAFLLGVMGDHTANAGRIYFPSGMPDTERHRRRSASISKAASCASSPRRPD